MSPAVTAELLEQTAERLIRAFRANRPIETEVALLDATLCAVRLHRTLVATQLHVANYTDNDNPKGKAP